MSTAQTVSDQDWDAEVFVLPFLDYTHPRIARNLLRFRHNMLGKARASQVARGEGRQQLGEQSRRGRSGGDDEQRV